MSFFLLMCAKPEALPTDFDVVTT